MNDKLNKDNEQYDVVYDEEKKDKKKGFFQKMPNSNDSVMNESNFENGTLYNIDSNNNSEVSNDFPNINPDFNYSNNVVFEEKQNLTTSEKIKEFVSTINMKALITIVSIFLFIIIIIVVIIMNIFKESNSYEAKIDIPNLIYMGETSDIAVTSKYTGKKKPKKNTNDTITTFEVKNKKVISTLEQETKGSEITNAIIPIQEGRSNIKVVSKLNGKTLKEENKEVIVCPSFDKSLLLLKQVTITKDSSYKLNLDYGEEECGRGITYESSNENIAKVDEQGNIKGLTEGQSIITIKKGIKEITFNVEVTNKYVELKSFKAVPNIIQLSEGEKYRLKIDCQPSNATSFKLTFSSSNEGIAKVSYGGLIEAISEGTINILVQASYLYTSNVKVVVTKSNTENSFATSMVLDKTEITLQQGKSEKVVATLTPESISNKAITWTSKDKNVATVNSNGIIYGKGVGKTEITASTSNGIEKTIKVTVNKMPEPALTISDNIPSNIWHTKPYAIMIKNPEAGLVHYYGTNKDNMKQTTNNIKIVNDENKTYYIKSCMVACTEKCTDVKDKKGNIQKDDSGKTVQSCKTTCSKKPSVCSDEVSYTSKLDKTKPQAVKVAGIENTPVKTDTVQIAFQDKMSLVQKWCVTTKNSYASCKWTTIQTNEKPVVNYIATANGIYYAFAKDTAGNISEGLKFEITNIE